jgi:tungstate transport system substrate-binding protein
MKRTGILLSILLALTIAASSCSKEPAQVLMMATTTSTDNTGLLDVLAPEFKKDTGIELKWVSVGTGKALQMGQNCDVDVLLVHAPDAEKEFVDKGFGLNRTELMYNDFVVIGPAEDPAGIKGVSVINSLNTIRAKKATFTSRGDKSGTHSLEMNLWKSTGKAVPEKEAWYVQTGQGMLQTINIAAERSGYTITDRGTFIKYEDTHKGNPPVVILVEGDKSLFNQYSAIEVNPEKCTNAKNDLAKKYIEWMASDKTQKMIGEFKLLNKPLFTPNAKK